MSRNHWLPTSIVFSIVTRSWKLPKSSSGDTPGTERYTCRDARNSSKVGTERGKVYTRYQVCPYEECLHQHGANFSMFSHRHQGFSVQLQIHREKTQLTAVCVKNLGLTSSSCTICQMRSTSNMYVQSFVFDGRVEWRFSESNYNSADLRFSACLFVQVYTAKLLCSPRNATLNKSYIIALRACAQTLTSQQAASLSQNRRDH